MIRNGVYLTAAIGLGVLGLLGLLALVVPGPDRVPARHPADRAVPVQ
ncbi:hypothetical protein [Curtobacterium sp. RRHDQ10]